MNLFNCFQFFFLGMQIAFEIDGRYSTSLWCAGISLAFALPNLLNKKLYRR